MRLALVVAILLGAAGLALAALGPLTGPLAQTCAPGMDPAACEAAVDAVLRRGLPTIHPLILGAYVEPGPAADVGQLGHRATVTFDLLGVPGPTAVALYSDVGGHWGGEASRGGPELVGRTLLPVLLGTGAGVALLLVARSRGREATA